MGLKPRGTSTLVKVLLSVFITSALLGIAWLLSGVGYVAIRQLMG